jgi:hypothetical protein
MSQLILRNKVPEALKQRGSRTRKGTVAAKFSRNSTQEIEVYSAQLWQALHQKQRVDEGKTSGGVITWRYIFVIIRRKLTRK